MTFAFGFNEDSDSEVIADVEVNRTKHLDQLTTEQLPVEHDLSTVLQSLIGVRLTYEQFVTPVSHNTIYRRQLFDIKHQLMIEDEGQDIDFDFSVDLQKNVYEGGLKSWECSYDLIDKLQKMDLSAHTSFLDMGCGTALPSAWLLRQFLSGNTARTIILSDFNYLVLRLVTIPNLLINWRLLSGVDEERKDELLITAELVDQFLADLAKHNISLRFISGPWGKSFNELVGCVDFLLTSETIYSLQTLPIVAESIIQLVQRGQIVIAAKNIYFGVGGSIIEFINYFNTIKPDNFTYTIEEIDHSQLKRSLIVMNVD